MTNLWTSHSGIAQHRACAQRWAYSKLRRLAPIDRPSPERDLGTWWHALRAQEAIQHGRERGTLIEAFTPTHLSTPTGRMPAAQPLDEAIAEWWGTLSGDEQAAHDALWGRPVLQHLQEMDARWESQWAMLRDKERVLGVEVKWTREAEDGTTLVGYVDEVLIDHRGLVILRDHKTTKALSASNSTDLVLDSQMALYAWGLAPALREQGIEEPVRFAEFDRIRTLPPKTPRLNLDGSLSKSIKDYDLDTYLAWCRSGVPYPGRAKDGSGAGTYLPDPEEYSRLVSPAYRATWADRDRVPVGQKVVRTHLVAALQTAEDMARTAARHRDKAVVPRSFGYGCRWCDFSKVCAAETLSGREVTDPDHLADLGITVRP